NLIVILFSSILVNNYILSKFFGICPFLGVSKKLSSAVGMSFAVTFVMTVSAAVTYPIYHFLLGEKYDYLKTLVFILVIAALVQMVEIILKKFMPPLYNSLGIYLPLITTNCAVLGVTLLNIQEKYNFTESVVNAFGSGLGFMLAMVLFSGIRERLEKNDSIPEKFKGLPVTLVAASIVSVAFMGFSGVVEGMFK
ncbi:MAG: electron transport complex protein RnfA, partial [Acutalibacteraceae bacterium]